MPIEIKELIIQALVGADKGKRTKPVSKEEKKKRSQLDTTQIVAEMLKQQKER